jgi:hypothetical protein
MWEEKDYREGSDDGGGQYCGERKARLKKAEM